MKKLFFLVAAIAMLLSSCKDPKISFVKVEDGRFVSSDHPSYFAGTNFWYGAILGSEGQGGDRERLAKELDFLKENGMVNLRVLVGGDGPDGIPTRVCPTLQKAPGVYNDTIFRGLDYLLVELAKRDMKAVLYLNNSWEWSGGYGMYLEWAGEGKALIPAEVGYGPYMESVSRFVSSEKAKALFADHVRHVVTRTNSITGKPYKEDPAIFSWQIGNEPRCFSYDPEDQQDFADWMWSTASLIKSLDPNHMVSSGSEGMWGCQESMDLYEKIHSCPDIDYMNIHIWPYNWSWVREATLATNLDKAIENTDAYIDAHLEVAAKYGKPVVLEEFGFPRDDFQFAKGTPTVCRDKYYKHILDRIVESAKEGGLFAGLNFWGWGGFAEQSETNLYWRLGDDYCGDPAQEQQGLNSVYATDESTIDVIRNAALEMDAVQKPTAHFPLENNGLYFGESPHALKVVVEAEQDTKVVVIMTLATDLKVHVKTISKRVKLSKGENELKYNLNLEPGFYEAILEVVEKDGSRRELARTNIGCEPEKIESPQDKQDDFDEFWSQTLEELRATAPEYRLTLLKEHSNEVRRTYLVDMIGFGGEPTCGILVEPVAQGCYEAVVHYMGYGGEVWYPHPSATPERIDFIFCNRNQALNRKPGEDNYWLTRGVKSKETYYYRGVFADAVRAIDFMCSRKNVDQDRLWVEGGSQGGAITLVAASLDHRIDAIAPSVPFLGDYRHYFQIVEWPGNWLLEAAEQNGMSEEELYTMLSYFDVKNFTDKIECPVIMAFGLQDVTCPPHTNFAGYNMIKSPKRWVCYPHSGHSLWTVPEWPEEMESWFDKHSPQNSPAELLIKCLTDCVEQGEIMYGHQDDLMYGHSWKLADDATEYVQSDVYATTGHYPAVYGMDLGGIEMGWEENLDKNNFDHMRASAVAHYERGGVVTFSWHPRNPLTGGDTWDVSSDQVVASILPGGQKHDLFMDWLAKAADFMESIKTTDGTPVPLVWRPWHEHTGSWFWWGQQLCTTEQYKALWDMTYEYMAVERGLNHLVWAYSPGAGALTPELFEERYPGDDIVDMVGFDCYQYGSDERYIAEMKQALDVTCAFAEKHGKLAAVTETGYEGIKNPLWWTKVLYEAVNGYPVSYVLTWRNACDMEHHFYASFPGHNSAEDFKAFAEKDDILFL